MREKAGMKPFGPPGQAAEGPRPGLQIDRQEEIKQRIAELTAEKKKMQDAAREAREKKKDAAFMAEQAKDEEARIRAMGPQEFDPRKQMMGLADATKGMFSSYAIGQSLGFGDKIGEKIEKNTRDAADNAAKVVDAINNLPKQKNVLQNDGG